ncbi:WecB/TagA/CpsF family glycosyltransferase [Arthrobacter caoxuetaonis]|uniref:WecB/TagA/CpsF family glycosyltransferase n=1 Tax=Arthrobacter caoxuetaonis TaxID=2886935 RepID=UPI001D134581|nr:WecB/TagA/CpsF family glycosyltransferase [Arthrobacter caoxuetaonis]
MQGRKTGARVRGRHVSGKHSGADSGQDRARAVLGGVPVDLLTAGEALARIVERPCGGHAPLAVASINLDHVHYFGTAGRWKGALDLAGRSGGAEWLNVIDGAPIAAKASALSGRQWPRLAGSDLIEPLLDHCEERGLRVGFLGGTSETHERLQRVLAQQRPDLVLAGCWAPQRGLLSDPGANRELTAAIARARVNILVVGLGKPRQELWIAEHAAATGADVLLAFGAVVDFLAGRVQRAPGWVSSNGVEWAWRLALEPRRMAKRYLVQGPPAYLRLRSPARVPAGAKPVREAPAREPLRPLPVPGGFAPPDGRADVAVLTVTHNNERDLEDFLGSLRAETADLSIRVIVADNSSTDATVAVLAAHPDVRLVETGGNLGYAGGINAAARYAGDAGAVLVLNPDLRVCRGAIASMLRRLQGIGSGIVVPLLADEDGSTYHSLRREPSITRAFGDALVGRRLSRRPAWLSEIEYDAEAYRYAHPVDWATGAALLVDMPLARRLGSWNESFFLYSEETEYFRRARSAGAAVWFEPAAKMIHRRGGSGQAPELAALMAVNRVRYAELHRSAGYAAVFGSMVLLAETLRLGGAGHRLAVSALVRPSRRAALPQAQAPNSVQDGAGRPFPQGSVIIPCHNEETVLGGTLDALAPVIEAGTEVIVVCNGCSDASAEVAKSRPGVRVLELREASKTAALNAGNAAADHWPRLYLDADITVRPETVRAVFEALQDGPLAVRPAVDYDLAGARFLIRSYYRARRHLPGARQALWGAGAYALSAEAGKRLGTLPAVVADDLYIDRAFTGPEKAVLDCPPVLVRLPRDVPGLLAILRRTYRGNFEQGALHSTALGSAAGILAGVRGPRSAFDASVYIAFTLVGRRLAASSRPGSIWERDTSSRTGSAAHGTVS